MNEKATILIVDDDEAMRTFIEYALSEKGYLVYACASAEEALKKINFKELDLAYFDYKLPGKMNGTDLAAKVKDLAPSLQILIITAYGVEYENVLIDAKGKDLVKAVISKPITAVDFEKITEEYLAKKNNVAA